MREGVPRPLLLVVLVNGALALASGLLVAALFAPLLTVKRLLFFADTVTLVSALEALVDRGELALFILLVAFSVLFPIAKLASLFWIWNVQADGPAGAGRALEWLGRLGRWSMLDVFVVALLVASVKLRWLADVEVRYGLYLFGGAVLLSMLLTGAIRRLHAGGRQPTADY